MQRLLQACVLLSVLSGYASTQAVPPDKHHEVQVGPSHTLKLWFSPQYGWRAKSYDQRYPGCTRQQEHRVYTADGEFLPDLLAKPNQLHWLSDPEDADEQALYIGQLGLPGGMMASKRVMNQASRNLNSIAIQAMKQGKMGALRRALDQAQEGADFDGVYERVFGKGSSEASDLAIFDLTVGEVRELSNYSELFAIRSLGAGDEEKGRDAEDEHSILSSFDLVEGLYAPVESDQHQAACRVLKSKKYEPAYSKVLPLTAGLLYKRYVDGKDAEARGLHVFWRYVLSDPQELIGIHQIVLNMRCMEACRADNKGVLAKLHGPILDEITSWVLAAWDVKKEQRLTSALLPALEGVWYACPCVLSYELLVEGALSKLRKWKEHLQVSREVDVRVFRTLTSLLGAAWPLDLRKAIVDYVLLGCKSEHSNVRCVATEGLSKALEGKHSKYEWETLVGALMELCKDASMYVRYGAVVGLSKGLESSVECSEEQCKGLIESLREFCGDGSVYVRGVVAESLSRGLKEPCSDEVCKAIVQALADFCKDKQAIVRDVSAKNLSKVLGKCSDEVCKAALELLKDLCRDDDWQVCNAAGEALSKGLEVPCSEEVWNAVIEALKGLCKNANPWIREPAAGSLSKGLESASGDAWDAIVEVLKGLCRDEHWKVRKAAAEGLSKGLEGKSEEGCKAIIEALTDLCRDKNEGVRLAAAEVLSKRLEGARSEEAWHATLGVLTCLFKDSDSDVRCAAAGALSRRLEGMLSEKRWKSILGILTSLCEDRDGDVRREAVLGLSRGLGEARSEEHCKGIISVFMRLCKDEDEDVRSAAALGLSIALEQESLGERCNAIVKILMGLCKDKYASVRSGAVVGLSKTLGKTSGGACEGTLETIIDLCKDEYKRVRLAVASGLSQGLERGVSEQGCRVMVDVLIRLCKDEYEGVRKVAVVVLSKGLEGKYWESVCKSILETLRDLLSKEEHASVWKPVYGSLVRLLCNGYGDDRVVEQAFKTLSQNFGYVSFWDIPDPVCESLHALLFGNPVNRKVRAGGWRVLCEGCVKEDSDMRILALESLSKVLLGSKLSVGELEEGVLTLFSACVDANEDRNVRGLADRNLAELMVKQQELLVDVLMKSLPLPALMRAICTYNPRLILPSDCTVEASGRVEAYFAKERQKLGWPDEFGYVRESVEEALSAALQVCKLSGDAMGSVLEALISLYNLSEGWYLEEDALSL